MKKLFLFLSLIPFFATAQNVNTILQKNPTTKVVRSYSSGTAGTDTLANVYKLNAFTEGQVPSWDATNKRFKASTVSLAGINTYVFSRNNSDVSGYKQAVSLNNYVEGLRDTAIAGASTTPVLLQEFATNAGYPNITVIPTGEFNVFYEVKKDAGAQNYWTYAIIYKRSLAGTETVIDTTEISSVTSDNTLKNVDISFLNSSNITLLSTDRIVVKVYAMMQSGTANISLYTDDATYARLTIPAASVDATNFVPYVGATKDLDMGVFDVTADSLNGNGLGITGVVHTTGNESVSGIKTFNNNLGIGKTPAVPLDVLGEISSTVNATGGGTNPTIAKFSAYQQSSGNSNYPAATFFVGSSASDLGAYLSVNPLFATGTTQIPSNLSLSTNYNPLQSSAKGLFISQTNTLARIGTGLAGNPSLSATPFAISAGLANENVRFFTNGNSSFGTTTDSGFKLDVNGTGRFSSNVTANSFIKSGGTSSQALMANGSLYALQDSLNSVKSNIIASKPAFVEQFITGFYGRGMLTAEPINVISEQFITGSASAGTDVIGVADTSYYKIGSTIMIRHQNGKYEPYFVTQRSALGLAIYPSLKYNVTPASKIERTWFNRAHPGKFYMRYLAQRIAGSNEFESSLPYSDRLLFTNLTSTIPTLRDSLVSISGATISYFNASANGASSDKPSRFNIGTSAFIDYSSVGQGAETQYFSIDNNSSQSIASVSFMSTTSVDNYSISVVDENDRILAIDTLLASPDLAITKIYKLPFNSRLAERIKIKVKAISMLSPSSFTLGQFDAYPITDTYGDIISKKNAIIVGLGDSWIAGDISTPERESIMTQLAIELPYATVINKGIGGNTVSNLLNRFDTDVTPYSPDYVIVNTGTNDAYNPCSVIFDPNAIDCFIDRYNILINKILAIGARPIIIGVPALAQSDVDVPTLSTWELNDRARSYSREFYKNIANYSKTDYASIIYVDSLDALNVKYINNNVGIGVTSPNKKLIVAPISEYTAINTGDGFKIGNISLTATDLFLGLNSTVGNIIQSRVDSTSSFGLSLQPFGGSLKLGTGTGFAKLTSGLLSVDNSTYVKVSDANTWLANQTISSGNGWVASNGGVTSLFYSGASSGFLGTPTNHDFNLFANNSVGLTLLASGGGALANNWTATTQTAGDNSTKIATTAYVDKFNLSSGTYTPTLTNVSNTASSATHILQYMRIGNTVTVSGRLTVQASSATDTEFRITLPIASNFTALTNAGGSGVFQFDGYKPVGIKADIVNDQAYFFYSANSTATNELYFSFTYQVL